MSVQIGLDDDAFRRAQGEVAATHDDLCRGLLSLSRSAGDVLEGWRGVAAGQYARAWAEWEAGAERILRSLLELADAMDLARRELMASDAGAVARSSHLAARLGES